MTSDPQVSQYTFAMCSYRAKKAEPQELMQLDGYTVDYCEPQSGRNTPVNTPVITPVNTPVITPVNTPVNTPVITPVR